MNLRASLTLPLAALAVMMPAPLHAAAVTRNFVQTANFNDYPPNINSPFGAGYSACWSYVHGDGREYAILGTTNGTAIYNVTDPYDVHFVSFIAGPFSAWREMKSYRNWIYIVTEGQSGPVGMQIVRMTNPEAPLLLGVYTATFTTAHTVAIDTARALLVCNGTKDGAGVASGMRILSIANPESPVELSWWPGGSLPVSSTEYVHDSVPIGNRLYASSIYDGIQRILDITNASAPVEIWSWNYPGGFTHNSWPDATGNWLYVTDEVNGEPLKIFDISNPLAPVLANAITSNPQAIVHNAHVRGNELYLSNYTEGIRALDLTDPAHPAEFASADSYPGLSGGFWGVWEVCPFFPSGTVIASDMQTGLYVYRPTRDYGLVRVEVESGGSPLAGADVYLSSQGDSLTTPADGIVQFAPSPGAHTVLIRKFGYYDDVESVNVADDDRDTLRVSLVARPAVSFGGQVTNVANAAALWDAEVELEVSPLHVHTNLAGDYAFASAPKDTYEVHVTRPGFIPVDFDLHLAPGVSTIDVAMQAAARWDSLELSSGWVAGGAGTGDNATTGVWTRVEPLGTGGPQAGPLGARPGAGRLAPSRELFMARSLAAESDQSLYAELLGNASSIAGREAGLYHEGHEEDGAVPGDVQPELDRTPGAGSLCFVTGQGTQPGSIGQNDVDNGKTSLTSPAYDLTSMSDPVIGFWRWFYASGHDDDWFAVLLSNDNGTNWVSADTLYGGYYNHWEEVDVHVADYLAPTTQVKIRFVAADLDPGDIVEAAVDDITAYDAANGTTVGAGPAPLPSRLALRAWPNPSRGMTSFAVRIPAAGRTRVELLDVAGRLVRVLHDGFAAAGALPLRWDGADAAGRAAPAGLYFVRAISHGSVATDRFVRVR